MGPIGAGKTTFSKTLENDVSVRISQDEMGRKRHKDLFYRALDQGVPRIIIDRMNFNKEQRKRYITPARQQGYCVTVFEFPFPDLSVRTKFHSRAAKRKDHPTIEEGDHETVARALDMYCMHYEKPTEDEYDNYNKVEG